MRRKERTFIWISYKQLLRNGMIVAVAALVIFLVTDHYFAQKTWMSSSSSALPLSGMIIAVDAGHGGIDGGAVGWGIIEKDINLKIALYLRDYLQEAGAVVVMTREVDKDLASKDARRRKSEDLHNRVKFVQQHKSDLLVSIHMNSMVGGGRLQGAQTFYDPSANPENVSLASLIQDEMKHTLGNTTREVATINKVYLLRTLSIPSALVEVGFLSNSREAKLLGDEKYQLKVAAAIYRGILRFSSGEEIGGN